MQTRYSGTSAYRSEKVAVRAELPAVEWGLAATEPSVLAPAPPPAHPRPAPPPTRKAALHTGKPSTRCPRSQPGGIVGHRASVAGRAARALCRSTNIPGSAVENNKNPLHGPENTPTEGVRAGAAGGGHSRLPRIKCMCKRTALAVCCGGFISCEFDSGQKHCAFLPSLQSCSVDVNGVKNVSCPSVATPTDVSLQGTVAF
eukprot:366241-Chlamydomonas_euryale.AAC.11